MLRAKVACCSQPARFWDDADRARYCSLCRVLRSLCFADGAVRILDYLLHQTGVWQAGRVVLSAKDLAVALSLRQEDAGSASTVDEMATVLRDTLRFHVAQLKIGLLGWDPRILRQSAVITDIEIPNDQTFQIHVSPLFGEVAAAFSGKSWPHVEASTSKPI